MSSVGKRSIDMASATKAIKAAAAKARGIGVNMCIAVCDEARPPEGLRAHGRGAAPQPADRAGHKVRTRTGRRVRTRRSWGPRPEGPGIRSRWHSVPGCRRVFARGLPT